MLKSMDGIYLCNVLVDINGMHVAIPLTCILFGKLLVRTTLINLTFPPYIKHATLLSFIIKSIDQLAIHNSILFLVTKSFRASQIMLKKFFIQSTFERD